MFDLDVSKMLLVAAVALVVIGPKDLPRVLRTVGQTVGKMRRMAAEFQKQFMDAINDAELESIKKDIADVNEAAKIDVSFDPAHLMRDEMTNAVHKADSIGSSTVSLESPTEAVMPPIQETVAPVGHAEITAPAVAAGSVHG